MPPKIIGTVSYIAISKEMWRMSMLTMATRSRSYNGILLMPPTPPSAFRKRTMQEKAVYYSCQTDGRQRLAGLFIVFARERGLMENAIVHGPGTENLPPPLGILFHYDFQLVHTLNFQNLLVCHQASGGFDLQSCYHGNTLPKFMLL